jgi:hypothetical protein
VVFLVKIFRKGISHLQSLLSLFFLIAFIIFAVFFLNRIAETSEGPIRDDTCRASVEAKSKFKLETFGSPLDLNCHEEETVSKAKTKSQINLDLATEMYRCWYKYGEGKRDWYDNWDFDETDLHCKVCSRVSYPDAKDPPTFEEFNIYLNEKELPGKDITFADYFVGGENAIIQFGGPGTGINPDEVMDLSKSIYLVYTIAKFDKDRIDDLREAYSKHTDGVAYGVGSVSDEVGSEIDPDTALALAGTFGAGVVGSLVGLGPLGWVVLFVGTASYTLYTTSGAADIPYYSLALFSADELVEVCG